MSKFPIFYLPRLTIIGVSSNLSQNILKLLRFFSGSEEAVRACSQPGRDVMQVRGPGPRGQQNIGACASWSPGDPCDIRPPTPAHRALAWGHQAWSPSSAWPDMEIIIPGSRLSPVPLSLCWRHRAPPGGGPSSVCCSSGNNNKH